MVPVATTATAVAAEAEGAAEDGAVVAVPFALCACVALLAYSSLSVIEESKSKC